MTELIELGYLDDARYAQRFAEDRRRLDGWGSDRIARRLRELGVDREHIDAALAAQDPEEEMAAALELLAPPLPDPAGHPRRARPRARHPRPPRLPARARLRRPAPPRGRRGGARRLLTAAPQRAIGSARGRRRRFIALVDALEPPTTASGAGWSASSTTTAPARPRRAMAAARRPAHPPRGGAASCTCSPTSATCRARPAVADPDPTSPRRLARAARPAPYAEWRAALDPDRRGGPPAAARDGPRVAGRAVGPVACPHRLGARIGSKDIRPRPAAAATAEEPAADPAIHRRAVPAEPGRAPRAPAQHRQRGRRPRCAPAA